MSLQSTRNYRTQVQERKSKYLFRTSECKEKFFEKLVEVDYLKHYTYSELKQNTLKLPQNNSLTQQIRLILHSYIEISSVDRGNKVRVSYQTREINTIH
jgi:hypothetical protein